jgi:PEGA domain
MRQFNSPRKTLLGEPMKRPFLNLFVLVLVFPSLAQTAQKPRVFITDSQSWEVSGSSGGSSSGFASHTKGGARPQTGEIIKTFGQRCPQVVVNNKQDKADYVVLLDHEGGKSLAVRDNKVAVFNSDGDSIVSHSTRSLGNAVKDACEAINRDWPSRASRAASSSTSAPQLLEVSAKSSTGLGATPEAASSSSQIAVSSMPANADIEVDGSFVGSTPSSIDVTPGEHSVVIRKKGYKDWQRKLKVTGGSINLAAELEAK